MSKGDIVVFALILTLALVLTTFGVVQLRDEKREAQYGQQLEISSACLLLGRNDVTGDSAAGYTLVEFGDYQCPPCRATVQPLNDALHEFHDKLRFDFRNLPFASIHPLAMPAAEAAEAAREQGKFWPMHDRLYRVDLSDEHLQTAAVAVGLDLKRFRIADKTTAKRSVDADVALAGQLGINSTPTLLLCTPDGHVLLLRSLSQLAANLAS